MARLKGTHNAMKSGILAAESAFESIASGKFAENTGEHRNVFNLGLGQYSSDL